MGTGIAIVASRVGNLNVKIIDNNQVDNLFRINYRNQENLQKNGLIKKYLSSELPKKKNMKSFKDFLTPKT